MRQLGTRAALLLVCAVSVAAADLYTLVLNDDGRSGNCRGNGGSTDKVDAKIKKLGTQVECSAECDRLSSCVGYTYSPDSENCAIHGEKMSGSCSRDGKFHLDECGTCSIAGKTTRSSCGSCSIRPSSGPGWTETENFCASRLDAVWTPGATSLSSGDPASRWVDQYNVCLVCLTQKCTCTLWLILPVVNISSPTGAWTAGTWTPPENGWTSESYSTVHVHMVDGAVGSYCYDKYPYDGLAQCKSTLETDRDDKEQLCQADADGNVYESPESS